MPHLFIKPVLGVIVYCTYALSVGGDDRVPTAAPTNAAGSATSQTVPAPPNAVQGEQTTNGRTTAPMADVIRKEGENRIARMPDFQQSAAMQPTAVSYPPLPMPADSQAEGFMRQADALSAQGNLTRAIMLYNAALNLAPRSAEIYRGRALTLLRMGDRVQAAIDYRRFLDLDPQAQNRVQQELQLFEQSTYGSYTTAGGISSGSLNYGNPSSPGYVSPGEVAAAPASSSTNIPNLSNITYASDNFATSFALQPTRRFTTPPYTSPNGDILVLAADRNFRLARNAFSSADYDNAAMWAQFANNHVPQARTHSLLAQIWFAQGIYSSAAAEARTAVAMAPLIDSSTLYSFYDFNVSRFRKHFQALQDFVRENPSTADARFLLGYLHRVLNQMEPAHAQLAIATVLDPLDTVAKGMLARDGVEVVGAEETANKNMMAREGVGGSVRVSRVPPPPAPPAVPTEEPIKR